MKTGPFKIPENPGNLHVISYRLFPFFYKILLDTIQTLIKEDVLFDRIVYAIAGCSVPRYQQDLQPSIRTVDVNIRDDYVTAEKNVFLYQTNLFIA